MGAACGQRYGDKIVLDFSQYSLVVRSLGDRGLTFDWRIMGADGLPQDELRVPVEARDSDAYRPATDWAKLGLAGRRDQRR